MKLSVIVACLVAGFAVLFAIPPRQVDWDGHVLPMLRAYAGKEGDQPLQGKTIVITGATSGIGKALTVKLAGFGASVIAMGRSESKLATLREEVPGVQTVRADMIDLEDVSRAADEVGSLVGDSIDILVNNAGMVPGPKPVVSPQGFDETFVVNYLSHVLLSEKLNPWIVNSTRPVIAHIASSYHWQSDGSDLDASQSDGPIFSQPIDSSLRVQRAYPNSKLAQILYGKATAHRSHPARIVSICPGWVGTNIAHRQDDSVGVTLMNVFGYPVDGWGLASFFEATFGNDTESDFYMNSGLFTFLPRFADALPKWTSTYYIRDALVTVMALTLLPTQRLWPWAGPFPSSVASQNTTLQDSLHAWSLNAVSKYM